MLPKRLKQVLLATTLFVHSASADCLSDTLSVVNDPGIEVCSGTNCDGYRGVLAETKDGVACIAWGTDIEAYAYTTELYASSGLESNYCRNPDSAGDNGDTIWCYTDAVSAGDWEYCADPNTAAVEFLVP